MASLSSQRKTQFETRKKEIMTQIFSSYKLVSLLHSATTHQNRPAAVSAASLFAAAPECAGPPDAPGRAALPLCEPSRWRWCRSGRTWWSPFLLRHTSQHLAPIHQVGSTSQCTDAVRGLAVWQQYISLITAQRFKSSSICEWLSCQPTQLWPDLSNCRHSVNTPM